MSIEFDSSKNQIIKIMSESKLCLIFVLTEEILILPSKIPTLYLHHQQLHQDVFNDLLVMKTEKTGQILLSWELTVDLK